MSDLATPSLQRGPLHQLHLELGARFVPFAGYEMPLHYRLGILKEHLQVRAAAGLFDVSHMGQLAVWPRHGGVEVAARALEALMPVDLLELSPGRQRYALLTNDAGGIVDDLMIANMGDHFFLVVNAARKTADESYLRAALADNCRVENLADRALLALQGPAAERVLGRRLAEVAAMRFLDARALRIGDVTCTVARSGYTGEDGFEISLPAAAAAAVARDLLGIDPVAPIGLGARDSLRLEAGLCLYGVDIDAASSPGEAALEWVVAKTRRRGGKREGGFPGASRILSELENGARRRRVGLIAEGRAPVRAGAALFSDQSTTNSIGTVSSGVFGPSRNAPIAMAYVTGETAAMGTQLCAELRGQRVAVEVSKTPFVATHYKR